jgi:hypothetical protein
MSTERPDEVSEPTIKGGPQSFDASTGSDATREHGPSNIASREQATVLVRGEAIRNPEPKSAPKEAESPPKAVSEAKVRLQQLLPALSDDPDVGVQKEQTVIRDGKADLTFTGTLLASAAPTSAPKGEWHEYRIYETNGGNYVFSKVTRRVLVEQQDAHEAEVFDPTPTTVPSQLLRSARDLARSRPLNWTDAAIAFFGYGPLAKALYRKLGPQFEEHIH